MRSFNAIQVAEDEDKGLYQPQLTGAIFCLCAQYPRVLFLGQIDGRKRKEQVRLLLIKKTSTYLLGTWVSVAARYLMQHLPLRKLLIYPRVGTWRPLIHFRRTMNELFPTRPMLVTQLLWYICN